MLAGCAHLSPWTAEQPIASAHARTHAHTHPGDQANSGFVMANGQLSSSSTAQGLFYETVECMEGAGQRMDGMPVPSSASGSAQRVLSIAGVQACHLAEGRSRPDSGWQAACAPHVGRQTHLTCQQHLTSAGQQLAAACLCHAQSSLGVTIHGGSKRALHPSQNVQASSCEGLNMHKLPRVYRY